MSWLNFIEVKYDAVVEERNEQFPRKAPEFQKQDLRTVQNFFLTLPGDIFPWLGYAIISISVQPASDYDTKSTSSKVRGEGDGGRWKGCVICFKVFNGDAKKNLTCLLFAGTNCRARCSQSDMSVLLELLVGYHVRVDNQRICVLLQLYWMC